MEDGLCDFELDLFSKQAIYKRFAYLLIADDFGEILKEELEAGLISKLFR